MDDAAQEVRAIGAEVEASHVERNNRRETVKPFYRMPSQETSRRLGRYGVIQP